jgi:hypothetical protein
MRRTMVWGLVAIGAVAALALLPAQARPARSGGGWDANGPLLSGTTGPALEGLQLRAN